MPAGQDLSKFLMDHLFKRKEKNTKTLRKRRFKICIFISKQAKFCFQHDTAYKNFKDLPRRTDSDKIFHNKPFNIAKTPNYDTYQRGHASMVYKFLDKKSAGGAVKSKNTLNQQLAEKLYKP